MVTVPLTSHQQQTEIERKTPPIYRDKTLDCSKQYQQFLYDTQLISWLARQQPTTSAKTITNTTQTNKQKNAAYPRCGSSPASTTAVHPFPPSPAGFFLTAAATTLFYRQILWGVGGAGNTIIPFWYCFTADCCGASKQGVLLSTLGMVLPQIVMMGVLLYRWVLLYSRYIYGGWIYGFVLFYHVSMAATTLTTTSVNTIETCHTGCPCPFDIYRTV